jgi:hypothetical protein
MNALLQRPTELLVRMVRVPATRILSAGITGKVPLTPRPPRLAKQTRRMQALRKVAAEQGLPGPEKLPEIRAKISCLLPLQMHAKFYY